MMVCGHLPASRRDSVDCILEYPNYVYILEFKLDGSADDALSQIEEKGYATPYLDDAREVIRVGVDFSSATRTVKEWKRQTR